MLHNALVGVAFAFLRDTQQLDLVQRRHRAGLNASRSHLAVTVLPEPVNRHGTLRVLQFAGWYDYCCRSRPMQAPTRASVVLSSDDDELAGDLRPAGSGEYSITRGTVEQGTQFREGNVRLVFAEDDPTVRKVTLVILKALGYQVQAYANGPELLAALDNDEPPIDMLLTDFDMPGLNGYELAGRLRALRPDIRVLLTSGMSEESIAPTVKPSDWPQFIPKPFSMRSLGHKLRQVLEDSTTSHS